MDGKRPFPLRTEKEPDVEQERDAIIFLWCVILVCATALIMCGLFVWMTSWFAKG